MSLEDHMQDPIPIPKPRRITNEHFLAWLRSRPCDFCGAPSPSEPHHVQTVGAGGMDYDALSSCRRCHDLIQDRHWPEFLPIMGVGTLSEVSQYMWWKLHRNFVKWVLMVGDPKVFDPGRPPE